MRNKKAFTLIELMVAMGVIAVISALSIFGVQQVLEAQNNTQKRKVLDNLDLELSNYLNNNGVLPSTVSFPQNATVVLNQGLTTEKTTAIKVTGASADYCYQVNTNNPQLYVTAVNLSSGTECKGTWNGATACSAGGNSFDC